MVGSGEICERMLEDLRLARSSAEKSIKGGRELVKIQIFFLIFRNRILFREEETRDG